jgi:hypothetical protein
MEQINKITRDSHPEVFDSIIEDDYEVYSKEHRRGSSFYKSTIHLIDEKYYPEVPELWGFWKSNSYLWDDNWGNEDGGITELTRVEQKEKTVVIKEWIPVI